ncbi:MAG: PAS domain S-box protein [Chitinivibrionales bacterium]|nr:PAS domain S-box protein [Chitinivibrionales bacterium]
MDDSPKLRGTPDQNLDRAKARIVELEAAGEELQKLREELKRSEERYRTAFEYTGTAMMVVEEDTTVTMGNHKLEEVTGYPQEEARKGHKWIDFVNDDDMKRLMEYHIKRRHDSTTTVPSEYEFKLKHRTGELKDILMNVSMIPGTKKSLISLIDITERKKAERALRESEEKFRELFENANDIIYTIDLEGNFTSANAAASSTYGYSPQEIVTVNMSQIIHEDFLATARSKVKEKLRSNEATYPYELLTISKDGEHIWVEVSTRLIRNHHGKPVGIQGIARNITDRKRAEIELKESETRFRETAETIPAVISEMDMEMKFTYVNKWGLDLFGFTEQDLKDGFSASDVLPPQSQETALEDFGNVMSGDFGNAKEYTMKTKTGETVYALVNSSPIIKNNKSAGMRSCLIDITAKKKTQDLLRLSEEKFRGIFRKSPIGIAILTHDGTILDKNAAFEVIFNNHGFDHKTGPLFSVLEPGAENMDSLARGKEIHFESECDPEYCSVDNGERHFCEWHITPLGSSNNAKSTTLLAQVQDITDRKLAEQARLKSVQDAAEKANKLVKDLKKELRESHRFYNMVSRSPLMKEIFDILPEVAQTNATVLVTGESGTGKELIARSLHEQGPRKNKPFIAINCSALPDNLLESELFGYKAGAFTDAKKDKPGKFTLAENGTIFLDEIGDISPAMQVKLLRVLQEKMFEPLGGTRTIKADVRVIAATNKDLQKMVRKGEFREDLYYRIKVLNIKLPPLRERRCDIPLLCDHFINLFNSRYHKEIQQLSDESRDALMAHDFPGNIRELENVIEHAFIFCKSPTITVNHLPDEFRNREDERKTAKTLAEVRDFKDLEKVYIKSVLTEFDWNKTLAAKKLGIHKATLFRKLKQLGINN